MSIECVNANFFCKLYKPIVNNVFSFLHEQEIANWAICCKIFPKMQEAYAKHFIASNASAWEKIISSNGRIVNLSEIPYSFKIVNDNIIFSCNRTRQFLNFKTLQIHSPTGAETHQTLIPGGLIDEKFSAFRWSSENHDSILIIDNNRASTNIKFIKGVVGKIPILGTSRKDSQSIEFFSMMGEIIRNCFDRVKSGKNPNKVFESFETIDCRPNKFQLLNLVEEIQDQDVFLRKVFKINDSYYFQWSEEGERSSTNQQIITFLKNIHLPKDHVELQSDSNDCVADDQFFYVFFQNLITIYKGSTVWRKIEVEFFEHQTIILFPTLYGLVVENTLQNGEGKIISVWDHRKYEPKQEKSLPFFHQKLNVRATYFVTNNLLFYLENKAYTVYHIPSRNKIGVVSIPERLVKNILASNDILPKYLVTYSLDFANTNSRRLRVFSLDTTEVDKP